MCLRLVGKKGKGMFGINLWCEVRKDIGRNHNFGAVFILPSQPIYRAFDSVRPMCFPPSDVYGY